jgi:putative hemolysin
MEPLVFGNLEVRLAGNDAEVDAAQALRYRIFYDEMKASPTPRMRQTGRDVDPYDSVCEHLLIIDREHAGGRPSVIGTYRMMRKESANNTAGFYSEGEFDLGPLLDYPGEVLELGRSCIDAAYRKRGAMQLLWAGIARYIAERDIEILFGCGSLPGTDPNEARTALSFLHHFHLAPSEIRPCALDLRAAAIQPLPKEAIDPVAAWRQLPPLMKGYLRLGGMIGKGAVIDHRFNTIDVCVVLETERLSERYRRHYSPLSDSKEKFAGATMEPVIS